MAATKSETWAELRIRQLHREGANPDEPKVRGQISQQAFVLFYTQGIRAVGVDLLVKRADIAKASFYRHFPSKEDLIIAYLEQRHDAWMAWLLEGVAERSDRPREQLLAIFDCLETLFCDPEYRGCPVTNAVSEMGAENASILDTARAKKAILRSYVEDLARKAAFERTTALAEAWVLLIDGAMVAAQREPGPASAIEARHVATVLLDHWNGSEGG